MIESVRDWLPDGKLGAVCFSVDDVHPGRSDQDYDGGGDLGAGAMGHLERLLARHPSLRMTLFITADWREISPTISRRVLARLPIVRERAYLAPILPKGSRRLDRHREFTEYLSALPRTELGLHGLHHVHPGQHLHVEFQDGDDVEICEERLREMLAIFDASGLDYVRGMCPPGWNAPPALLEAMGRLRFDFVASSRDIRSEVALGARANMSGLMGTPLMEPAWIAEGPLMHFTVNFQATSPIERAIEIVNRGGLLAIKAHIIKNARGHVAIDGVDAVYCNYLDLLFTELERRFGSRLWWTSMGEIAARVRERARSSDRHDARV